MSDTIELSEEAREWRDELEGFLASYRERQPLPAADDLDPLRDEQRRITGGRLLQFLQFIQREEAFEAYPVLEEQPITDRVFVFATDVAGLAAARDIVDSESTRAVIATKEEWRAWLEAPATEADETFECHYECWSVWHQNLQAHWASVEAADGSAEYWVHEEGFALADRAGRGGRHLWSWDGDELALEEQDADDWSSSPPMH